MSAAGDTRQAQRRTRVSTLRRRVWIGLQRLRRGRFDVGMLLKPIVPRGLFGRSLIIIIAPVVLTQAIVTYIFFERHWDEVTRRLARTGAGDIALITETYERLGSQGERDALADRAERNMRLTVAFWEGETLPNTRPSSFFSVFDRTLRRELSRKLDQPFWFDTTAFPHHVDIRIEIDGGVLRMIAQRKRLFATTGHIFVIWMLGTSIILLAVAILFLRNQVRPITRLARAAESFGKGRDMPHFRPAGAREVRQAAIAFLDMKNRIERHLAQRTEMLAGVSHDLRTPLTRLKLELAMFEDSPEIEAMRGDIAEMERMLEEYLAFARGEGGETADPADLRMLLEEIAQNAERQGFAIALTARGETIVPVRREALRRAVTNLVTNASRHASHAEIRLRRDRDGVRIILDDDGPGIPEDQWDEAFRPFHRLDEGRNLDSGGVGLGLSVARDIARSHGGDLTLDHSPLGGLRAILRLPA